MPACRPEGLPEGLQFCNFEYNLWGKHAEYFDQQMGTRHNMWGNKDVKIMKICTIILIGMMILALKVLALLTLSMGTLILERVIFMHGWMPVHMATMTTH